MNKRTRTTLNLRQGHRDWYRIQNLAGGAAEVMIYDEIGFYGVSAQDFIQDLAGLTGPLTLRLNTPGGEVFDGIAIYNALRSHPGEVSVVIDGIAASIGSVIAMAASPGKLAIAKRAQMMIHDGFTLVVGNAADMREAADQLDQQSDNIAGVYADRTGKSAAHWREQMKTESWYIGQQAVDAGLADMVVDPSADADLMARWDLSIYAHAPAPAPASPPAQGFRNAVMHGDHERIDPDGDGDCDACPEGDTDHDFWSPEGEQIKDLPGQPVPTPSAAADGAGVDASPWDAAQAWHNGATSDDPAAFYAGICAGTKAGDKATQGAWALPYRYTPSSPPNAAGVRAALARFSQTDGLTNKDEALAKLQSLMKKIDPDWEPGEARVDSHLLQALFLSRLKEAQ